MLRRLVWYKFTDVSDMVAASNLLPDGSSKRQSFPREIVGGNVLVSPYLKIFKHSEELAASYVPFLHSVRGVRRNYYYRLRTPPHSRSFPYRVFQSRKRMLPLSYFFNFFFSLENDFF
jgi:hypothetical protein